MEKSGGPPELCEAVLDGIGWRRSGGPPELCEAVLDGIGWRRSGGPPELCEAVLDADRVEKVRRATRTM